MKFVNSCPRFIEKIHDILISDIVRRLAQIFAKSADRSLYALMLVSVLHKPFLAGKRPFIIIQRIPQRQICPV